MDFFYKLDMSRFIVVLALALTMKSTLMLHYTIPFLLQMKARFVMLS